MNKNKTCQTLIYAGLITLITLPLSLTGCNTIEGAGQDIQEGGKSLERAAKKNR